MADSGKARAKKGPTLRARMMASFVFVAAVTTLLFVIVLSLVWNGQFSAYTRSTLEELATSTASSLERSYAVKGYWTAANLENAAQRAESLDDIGVQILNAGQGVLYDSTLATSGQSMSSYSEQLSLAPDLDEMVTASVKNPAGEVVGTVRVWVYGSEFLLTQRDGAFRSSSFIAMAGTGVASVVLALILGLGFSRVLTVPVRTISHAAARIKEGDLSARSGVSGNDDLGELGQTFDAMAEKMENDRELERRLTNDMAHELRTPLMSMLATIEAMQDGVYAADQEHLAMVRTEIMRLSRLVDGMLNLSRLENGSVKFVMEPVDVVELVDHITESHKALLGDMGLDLTFENATGEDEFEVELDRDTITQAVTNLVSNAMRYTPAPGKVTVYVAKGEDEALISVRDSGIGIAKEDVSRVFGRFWRADESRNRAKGGLGVGLAVTKEILDHHHGSISVDSIQGVGTTFTLHLPLVQPQPE